MALGTSVDGSYGRQMIVSEDLQLVSKRVLGQHSRLLSKLYEVLRKAENGISVMLPYAQRQNTGPSRTWEISNYC